MVASGNIGVRKVDYDRADRGVHLRCSKAPRIRPSGCGLDWVQNMTSKCYRTWGLWMALASAATGGCGEEEQPDDKMETADDGTDAGVERDLPSDSVALLDKDDAEALCDDIESAYAKDITPEDELAFGCTALAFLIWVTPSPTSEEEAERVEQFRMAYCLTSVENCIEETEPSETVPLCSEDPKKSFAQCAAPPSLLTDCAEESNRYRKWMIKTLTCETLGEPIEDPQDAPTLASCEELKALCPEQSLVRDM